MKTQHRLLSTRSLPAEKKIHTPNRKVKHKKSMCREKKSQITESQKNCLIEFLKRNPNLQSGKFSNQFTFKDAQRKWTEIGTILNSMPGATRDWKGWRKTWQDLKSRTKLKVSNKRKHVRGTGGGPPVEEELSKLEEDIVDIVKVVSIKGHKEASESVVNFNFSDDENFLENSDDQQNEVLIIEGPSAENDGQVPGTSREPVTENRKAEPTSIEEPIPKKKKSSTLRHTIDAVNDFKVGMDTKIGIKKKYYSEKIELMKRITIAKERKADASERRANAEERTASAYERIAMALESFSESIL
ncbi:unnamed protein product [Phaedon cochleariae]|uniref:Regulatory protein zeste n=1 Tax=Phaedon cochleariae TaxID=80249 RepID=A0A9N9SBZ3_PHACE|nr:unnamed protein product [Phaedon cochleariae]